MNDFSRNMFASMSDGALLELVGAFVQHHRLNQNKSQSEIAAAAGISRSTLSLIERGEKTALISLIQVLRALDLLYIFQSFEISKKVSPVLYAKLQMEQRKRAGRKDNEDQVNEELEW